MKITSRLGLTSALTTFLLTLTLSACAADMTKRGDSMSNDEYLPFSIVFDKRGNPVVLDRDGNKLEFREAQFPIKANAIEKIESFSFVQYRGSHVALIVRGGHMIAVKLPHN